MIHALTGTVQSIRKQAIAFLVGPMVIELAVAEEAHFVSGKEITLFTYLHWNQEQGPSLYGFPKEAERAVFILIIGCSGIGPRIALAVLAELGSAGFVYAVQKGDEQMLSKVNGIGVKKAEYIIVHLKHKINSLLDAGLCLEGSTRIDWHTISEALRALNYSRGEISQAIAFIRSKNPDESHSFDQLLRQALSFLSKQA